jgi:hypothetical protein
MKVEAVKVTGPNQLQVKFKDGYIAQLNLAPLPELYPIFESLTNPDVFGSAKVEADTVAWGDLDICPDVLRAWCEAGRVLSKEETSERFRALQDQFKLPVSADS